MYLAIDIGTSYTKIAGMLEGEWVDLNPEKLIIPTAAAYLPSTGQIYFGNLALRLDDPGAEKVFFFKLNLKRNTHFQLGPFTLGEVIKGFLSFLFIEYLEGKAPPVKTLALSIPNYFGLKSRQILHDAARQVFGLDQIYLVPEPLAGLIAYNTLDKIQPLEGTVLSIDVGGGTTDFSFLDAVGDRQEFILEAQFQIGYDAFSGSELDHAIIRNIFIPLYQMQTGHNIPEKYITGKSLVPKDRQLYNYWLVEAEKFKLEVSRNGSAALYLSDFYKGGSISSYLDQSMFLAYLEPVYRRLQVYCQNLLRDRATRLGLADSDSWHIDSVLLQGGGALAPGVKQIISECFPGLPVILSDSMDMVARGLCCWINHYTQKHNNLKAIYPFDFYREIYDSSEDQTKLERIPFDTANLELDILGRYKILSFSPPPYVSANPESERSLKIYEVAQGEATSTQERFLGMEPVLDVRWPESKLPAHINILLDLNLCRLETDFETVVPTSADKSPSIFRNLSSRQLDALKLIENYKYINPDLINDFSAHLDEQKHYAHSPYDNHAQTVRYKLLCLLQILDSK